ncbi:MAG: hypothetical protein ABI748_09765, partial [Dokdonella sp.]
MELRVEAALRSRQPQCFLRIHDQTEHGPGECRSQVEPHIPAKQSARPIAHVNHQLMESVGADECGKTLFRQRAFPR